MKEQTLSRGAGPGGVVGGGTEDGDRSVQGQAMKGLVARNDKEMGLYLTLVVF